MLVLVISGSLRAASSHSKLLDAAAALAPAGVETIRYDGLADLPHFNPDVEGDGLPAPVAQADAIVISRPS